MIYTGDCLDVMPTLDAESIDAIVTDPPYGIGFMGKAWDDLSADAVEASWNTRGRNLSSTRDPDAATPGGRMATGTGFAAPNPRCANCGRAINGRDTAKGFKVCHCETPVYAPTPNRQAQRSQAWHEAWAREAYRVAKPGAYLVAFGGTRTVHRLACAIEDAGWEIRDCLVWAYASGFPKSLDVSKVIDKAAGAEREATGKPKPGHERFIGRDAANFQQWQRPALNDPEWQRRYHQETAPATPEAAKWQGWGTALKPAWEPIILARKPLRGTVAANVQRYGTGALNIDGCRIGVDERSYRARGMKNLVDQHAASDRPYVAGLPNRDEPEVTVSGRWPANVILTDPIFDGGWDGVVGGGEASYNPPGVFGRQQVDQPTDTAAPFAVRREGDGIFGYGDSGIYSRFFLIPKASRSDREPVLGGLEEGNGPFLSGRLSDPRMDHPQERRRRANVHPTVKPTDLMRHLVRLVTPPGGIVLDPFLGSGTTALAAEMEGFRWVGIEREEEYVRIAEARLNGTQRGLAL